jgi:predicted NBD/HSP70 family sugar kinase
MNETRSSGVSGTNLEHAKKHNRRVVIETVRLHGCLPRAEIARLTSLTPQTVSNIVSELQDAGFLTAQDRLRGGRGQPATPMSINPDGAYSIGLQLDQRVLIAVAVDLSGRVRARAEAKVDRPTPAQALPLMARLVRQLRESTTLDWRRVLGAGLAMPGPFGADAAQAFGADTLPGWEDPTIVERIAGELGLPVLLENDANASAIGERLYGVARNLRSFVYMFVGIGLGAGIFLDGRLYKGISGNAGEIGHMIVVPGGRQCTCSNQGCLERYLSLRAAYEALAIADLDRATPELLTAPSAADAPRVEAWVESVVDPLRRAVNILESVLDTEAVIIGGFLPTPLIERLAARLDPLPAAVGVQPGRTARVLIGTAGHDTTALGAAALPIFDEFNPQYDVLLKG